jgi:hypothetical protein
MGEYDPDLGAERTDYRLNTTNTEIVRITQIFSEQYLILNNEIGRNCKTVELKLARMVVVISDKRCGFYTQPSEHNGLQ